MGVYKELRNGRKSGNSKAKSTDSGRVPFNELRFVDLTLTPEDKEEFRQLCADGRFDASPFDDWLREGYTFKLRLQGDRGSVSATLVCDNREHVCGGGVLSAFAGDSATAIALLCYKDQVLAGEHGWFEAALHRGGGQQDIG